MLREAREAFRLERSRSPAGMKDRKTKANFGRRHAAQRFAAALSEQPV